MEISLLEDFDFDKNVPKSVIKIRPRYYNSEIQFSFSGFNSFHTTKDNS